MVKPHYKIIWDRKALDHFKDILTYLEKQSKQAPKIIKDAIISRLDVIKTNPLISELDKLKDPPNKDFRAFVVFSCRVTYQIKSDEKKFEFSELEPRTTWLLKLNAAHNWFSVNL